MNPNSSRIWRPASFCSSIAPLDQKMRRAARWGWRSAYIQRDLAVPQVPLDPLQILEHARGSSYRKHRVLFAMTGAGRPVIGEDLLAQIGTFRFRFIVEEGSLHAVLVQTQGCQPVTINPKIFLKLKSTYGKSAASYRFGAGWQTGDCGFNSRQNQRSG